MKETTKKEKTNQENAKKPNVVFLISAAITIAIALWGIISNDSFSGSANQLMASLKQNFSWLYLGVMLFFVVFSLIIAFSKFGKIRLGADDERPEYSTISWFAMLFAAGMGIGLVFWGVAEPISHYVSPMKGIEPHSAEAARFSIRSCIMHWGLHPWACYAVMGLGLAFFQFRKKESALASNLFKPMLGDKKAKGPIGKAIDIFTTIITVTGVATSFGMGCLQICSGLEHLFSIPNKMLTWITVITIICFIYLQSAISGVGKGVKLLSNINLVLFSFLLILAFFIGPAGEILNYLLVGIKDYLVNFIPDSLRLSSQGDSSWIQDWRVFYWAWWLSWAPFVGVFIARISRGRTIREFILGVMIIPTAVSAVWFSTFGGVSLHAAGNFAKEQLAEIAAAPQTTLFYIFDQYKAGIILSLIAIVLLIIFFITSADSATFVLSMLTSDGELNPPNNKKIFWGILIAVVAFALIMSGSISVIQTISIVIAFPYLFILLLICVNLVIEMKKDQHES
ncbi:MAG: BCCT family transporter [Lachnospiraceae bacterium]|nr:BCCT family transporter [Lachnospiraceae bacterium]